MTEKTNKGTAPRTITITVGKSKTGAPRIWIEGKHLERNGFAKGTRVETEWRKNSVRIRPVEDGGDHTVSERRGAQILDYTGEKISEAFDSADRVRVVCSAGELVIEPARSEERRRERLEAKATRTAGSIFSGGGLLDESSRQAGFRTEFGVEHNPKFADVWQSNHSGRLYQGCISEVPREELPNVELFTGGIPCEPFSKARRNAGNAKREDTGWTDHELADMSIQALLMIDATNPRTIVLEEVESYLESSAGLLLIRSLERMGYTVDSRVIDGREFGALTPRKRAVIVAVSEGEVQWPEPEAPTTTLGEILIDEDDERAEWFHIDEKTWLRDHWKKQIARGNKFVSQKLTRESESVQAIKKRYFAGQGDNPIVAHPTRPDVYRWLTIDEVKVIMGVPADYDLGSSKTYAGEILGQGVLVDVFRKIIEANTSAS